MKARGRTNAQIADELGVAVSTVTRGLARVEARELKRMGRRVLRLRIRQHAQLDHVIAEAMAAWERANYRPRRSPPSPGSARQGREPPRTETRTTRKAEGQCGDPRLLASVLEALSSQRSLWGLAQDKGTAAELQPQAPTMSSSPRA